MLVPFDGSPTPEKALDEAIGLARLTGARRRRLHVVGSHGRRGTGRVVMGSDAEQTVRTTPVPVRLVRGTGDAAR